MSKENTEQTKQLLADVEKTLESYQGKLEARVQTLIAEGKGEADTEIKGLKAEVEKISGSITNVQQQIKNMGDTLPGLRDDLEKGKSKFLLQNFVRGLYLTAHPGECLGGRDPWKGAEFEKEVMEQTMKARASNYAGDLSAGGALIPWEVQEPIVDLVYAAVPLLDKLPTTKLSGLVGNIEVPIISGGHTAYMIGENEAPTGSAATFEVKQVLQKRCAAQTFISKTLLFQSGGRANTLLRDSLVNTVANKIHQQLVAGSGSEYQVEGLNKKTSGFTAATGVVGGTNGGRFTLTDAALLKAMMEEADEGNENPANYGYLMRPIVKYGMLTERVMQYSDQSPKKGQPVSSMLLLNEPMLRDAIGAVATSTHVLKTQVKGSSSSASYVYYGNWRYFWICMWADMAIRASDQATVGSTSAFAQNGVFVQAEQGFNSVLTRPKALTYFPDAETNPSLWTA